MDGHVPVNKRPRVRTFYESFVNTVYGFVLVLGFQQFLRLPALHIAITFGLLVTAYVTVLHYWLVFVASTEDTFSLILSTRSDAARMGWFWIELVFATAMIIPMLEMFEALTDVSRFARVMLTIAILSLAWDLWAFAVGRYHRVETNAATPETRESPAAVLIRWIGLDLLFVLIMLLMVGIVDPRAAADRVLISWSLFAVTGVGAILDTLVIAPSLFLRSDVNPSVAARSSPMGPLQ